MDRAALRSAWRLLGLAVAVAVGALGAGAPALADGPLAPLPPKQAASTHGPFAQGECEACHAAGEEPGRPGPVVQAGDGLCFECHDEFLRPVRRHPRTSAGCLRCHSPHNAKKKKLLLR